MMLRLAVTLLLPLVVTQSSFEGRLRMRTVELQLDETGLKESWLDVAPSSLVARDAAKVEEMSLQIRNNVLRIEKGDGDGGYALMDLARKVMVIVMQEERMYMEVPMGPGGSGGPVPADAGTPQGASPVKVLGQTRTINGLSVKGYEIRRADQIVRAWMTQDFPGLTWAFRNAAAQNEEGADPDDADMGQFARYGFPVLMITLTDGSLIIEEALSIERATLGADLFKAPAGFTRQSMPGGP